MTTTASNARSSPALAPAGPTARRFRPDIQGLRAVAVLLVLLFHADVPGLSGGYVGVDVFFVISGFLITRALIDEVAKTGRVNFVAFYGRRMRRLLPAAALVVITTLVIGRLVLTTSEARSLLEDALYSAVYAVNYHLAIEGTEYQNATQTPSALQHLWSLSVEEQFYFVWPLLIGACAVLASRRLRLRTPLMIGAIGVLSAVTLYFSIAVTPVNPSMGYFGIHTRAWELGVGALLALTLAHLARIPGDIAARLTWIGLAMILASAVLYDENTVFPGFAALLPVAGAALVIAGGTHRNPGSAETNLLERRPMQYMGKVSYAWYLWHWPLIVLLPIWADREFGWLGKVQLVVLAFWFAVLTYFLENAGHRSSWGMPRWVATGVGITAGVAAVSLGLSYTLPAVLGRGAERITTELASADTTAVQAAIADGATITAVPANLTPTVGGAVDDKPVSSADGCHAQLLDTAVNPCTYGAVDSSKTAVLLGDSHAQQWLGALIPEAEAAGWRIVTYTKAACPVADVSVWNPDLGRAYTECDTWREEAHAQIRELKPALIIAGQSDLVPWESVTDEEWADATVRTLRELADTTSRVVFIGDNPTREEDPETCLEANLDDARACAVPRSDAFPFFPERHTAVASAVTAAGFGFLDPLDFFCTDTCPAVVGNMPVHRDAGHVTNTYATWLAPMFEPIFKDVTT